MFLLIGKTRYSSSPETPSCLISQFSWFNKYIQIENNPLHLKYLSKNINFLSKLFEGNLYGIRLSHIFEISSI